VEEVPVEDEDEEEVIGPVVVVCDVVLEVAVVADVVEVAVVEVVVVVVVVVVVTGGVTGVYGTPMASNSELVAKSVQSCPGQL